MTRPDPGVGAEPALGGGSPRERSEDSADPERWTMIGDEPALAGMVSSDAGTWHDTYLQRRASATAGQRATALLVVAAIAGPASILGAFFAGRPAVFGISGVLIVVIIGPAIEEVAKAAGALWLVDRRPWLVPAPWVLPTITVAAGLVFAAIENVLYLEIYIDDPSDLIIRWRWIAGPLLHGGASLIAGLGIARAWRRIDAGPGLPDLAPAVPWVVAAIAVHGGYNLTVTILELTGRIF